MHASSISHQIVFYLIKPAIVCSENKVCQKILSKQIWFGNLNRGQHRSLDDIIFAIHRHKEKVVIRIKCEYCILYACF